MPGVKCRMMGLTLIEVVVVMAIIAILLSLAIPSYRQYLQRGDRAEAIRTLLEMATCQERARSDNGYYDTTRCLVTSQSDFYRFRIEPADSTESLTYTLFASPLNRNRNDNCGELSLDQKGTRGVSGDQDRLKKCWGGG